MHLPVLLLTLSSLLLPALSAGIKNNTREFQLKTALKPNQPSGKARFANLYLEAYHTGAGENDAVMVPSRKAGIKGFLNATSVGNAGGQSYHTMIFDLGNPFPWYLDMEAATNFYAAWEPVEVNTFPASPAGGFWINDQGLQWTSDVSKGPDYKNNEFAGWLVCDWWHGAPQLFFRISSYSVKQYPTIATCAEVNLVPEYV